MARALADSGSEDAARRAYALIGETSEDYGLELAALQVELGYLGDARDQAGRLLEANPSFSLDRHAGLYPWKHPYRDMDRAKQRLDLHIANLRDAGLPG